MIKKKICMLGYFAVGKTSLVRRFVQQIFSEKYQTTIGVKIDKKEIILEDEQVQLLIWDIHGEDRFQKVQKSYLVGSSGYFLVVDSTRAESLDVVEKLMNLVKDATGDIPYLVLLNKSDLQDEIMVTPQTLLAKGIELENIIPTSAKTGQGVDEAFLQLTKKMICI